MLEAEFQTTETQPPPFPWLAVVLALLSAFACGAAVATAALLDGGTAWRRVAPAPAGFGLVMWVAWGELRRRVTTWRRAYAMAIEYVARRKREAEGGLRFEAP